MKKTYIRPNLIEIEIDTQSILKSSGAPNSNWTQDDEGNWVNPGGKTPPGHNKHEYHNELWQ